MPFGNISLGGVGIIQSQGMGVSVVSNFANYPTPEIGLMIFDASEKALKVWNGTTWKALGGSMSAIKQVQYKISDLKATHNSTSMIEVSADYRVSITPSSSSSFIIVQYNLTINPQCANNTIFLIRATRNGNAEVITSAGSSSGSRWRMAGGAFRPGNGYDTNDMNTIQFSIIDAPNTTSEVVYGFQMKQETSGTGNIYFGYSASDNNNWGWTAPQIITAYEVNNG